MLPSMVSEEWRRIAVGQGGLLTRSQLSALGVDRWAVRHRLAAGRWVAHTPTVIGTTTGELTRSQLRWIGVLHSGPDALIGDLSAAEVAGLRNWQRDVVTVLVPHGTSVGARFPGLQFVRTRRPLREWRRRGGGLPVCRLEPAVLRFASTQKNPRVAEGVLAAVVQQRLTSPETLLGWVDRMQPLQGAERFRRALAEIGGGAQSSAELDVRRMCRAAGLRQPERQVRRRDADGRLRFTDCEWRLADGRVLVLEVDGGFHRDVEHWEDDIARQRALTSPYRMVVRCTARELRDEPERVARDLRLLGVPAA
jgi:very-short-patch-repair endonuclease